MSAIEVRRDGAIASVTLNRPERRNALSPDMLADLERVATEFRDDLDTRIVIVRAEGRDFSVGADLSGDRMGAGPTMLGLRRTALLGGRLMRAIQEIHQPTIAAVQGIAMGGAACIASACDFRVGAEGCRAGYGEVKLGINLMWNAVPVCVHLIGPARAKRMIMSGDLIDGATLLGWGFLDELVAPENLDAAARAMADKYAALPPIAVQMIKRSINAVSGAMDAAIMHADADQWVLATRSQDFREGVKAFFEKRDPSFTGD